MSPRIKRRRSYVNGNHFDAPLVRHYYYFSHNILTADLSRLPHDPLLDIYGHPGELPLLQIPDSIFQF